MVKTRSVGSSWCWLDTVSPGISETNVSIGDKWLNTVTQNFFICKNSTLGAQVWDEYPSSTVSVDKGGTGAVTLTGILTGNGTSAITGNAVTQHGVLVGGASNAASSLSVASTGTVLTGVTGADPAFSATPSVTSITFGAETALEHYLEQQAWTPVITGATIAGAGTYTAQYGFYTRIGNMIFADADITWTAHTGTGDMTVTGFPFTVRNTTGYDPEALIVTSSITFPVGATFIEGHILNNTSVLLLYGAGSGIPVSPVQMSNAGTVHVTIAYLT